MSFLSRVFDSTDPKYKVLSDHAPCVYSVSEFSPKEKRFPLYVLTYNKMNKGHSTTSCRPTPAYTSRPTPAYTNNPLDRDESFEDYKVRMNLQYDYLETQMKTNNFTAILLQEVNDLISKRSNSQLFLENIKKIGWDCLLTTRDLNTKPMAILYDCSKLTFSNKVKGILPSPTGKKFGFSALFHDNINNKPVCIATCHLDYSIDFRREVINFQVKQIKKNIFTIIVGDTNKEPNHMLPSFFGNIYHPSSINRLTKDNVDYYELKKVDCIAASPSLDHKVIIKEKTSLYFSKNLDGHIYLEKQRKITSGESNYNFPYVNKNCLTILYNLEDCDQASDQIKKIIKIKKQLSIHLEENDLHLVFEDENDSNKLFNYLSKKNKKQLIGKENHVVKLTHIVFRENLKEFAELFHISCLKYFRVKFYS